MFDLLTAVYPPRPDVGAAARESLIIRGSRASRFLGESAVARGGFSGGGLRHLMENLSFWGSGRPRAAQKPFKKVGGKAPYLFKRFSRLPGAAQNPKTTDFPSNP